MFYSKIKSFKNAAKGCFRQSRVKNFLCCPATGTTFKINFVVLLEKLTNHLGQVQLNPDLTK